MPQATHRSAPTEPLPEAFAPMSVALTLADDLDVSRGDMLCRTNNRPQATQDIEAMVCWLSDRVPLTRATACS